MRQISVAVVIGIASFIIAGMSSQIAHSVEITNPPLRAYSSCLSEAIAGNNVTKVDDNVQYVCAGPTAKSFYDLLGRYGYKDVVQTVTNYGKYLRRFLNPPSNPKEEPSGDVCYHQVEAADGAAIEHYQCVLYMEVGPLINQ